MISIKVIHENPETRHTSCIEVMNEGPHATAGLLLDVLNGWSGIEPDNIKEIVINPHAEWSGIKTIQADEEHEEHGEGE